MLPFGSDALSDQDRSGISKLVQKSPKETILMKCQVLFSLKNKEKIL